MFAVGLKTGVKVASPPTDFVLPHILTGAAFSLLVAAVLFGQLRLEHALTRLAVAAVVVVHMAIIWPHRAAPPGLVANTTVAVIGMVAAVALNLWPSQRAWWAAMAAMWTGPGLEIVLIWPMYLRPVA